MSNCAISRSSYIQFYSLSYIDSNLMDQKATLEEKFRKSTLTSFSSFFSFTNVTCGTFLIPLLYWGKIKNVFYSTDAWCFVPESTVLSCKSKASQLLFSQRRPARFITASKISALIMKTLSLSLAVRNFTAWGREEGGQTQTASLFSSAEKTLPLFSN